MGTTSLTGMRTIASKITRLRRFHRPKSFSICVIGEIPVKNFIYPVKKRKREAPRLSKMRGLNNRTLCFIIGQRKTGALFEQKLGKTPALNLAVGLLQNSSGERG
jgi:hypothetical protein